MNKKKSRYWIILLALLLLVIAVLAFAYQKYKDIFFEKAGAHSSAVSLYVPTGTSYNGLMDSLWQNQLVKDTILFNHVAKYKKLPGSISPGHYLIEPNTSINKLINKIKSNDQTPVKVTFHNIRTIQQFAGKIARQLELDSAGLLEEMQQPETLEKFGIASSDWLGFFIPNTYEFYWNTSPARFLDIMSQQHENFWNAQRRKKAKIIGLTPVEIATLASIVQEESNQVSEMDRIAGVYINRLNKGMLLQADPTLKFANNDWTLRRVLNRHKEIDSPYNTYKYPGLPPAPVSMPEPQVIDQVLSYEKHNYLFFVASVDKPGFHEFSSSLREHNNKANRYRQQLNQRKIYQ